jgi:hypothetical protein
MASAHWQPGRPVGATCRCAADQGSNAAPRCRAGISSRPGRRRDAEQRGNGQHRDRDDHLGQDQPAQQPQGSAVDVAQARPRSIPSISIWRCSADQGPCHQLAPDQHPAAAGDHNEKQEHRHLGHQQVAIGGLSSDDRDYPVPEGRRRHRPLPVVTAARPPPGRTASARSPMLGADRGRRRAVRAQPASTASARPLVIALNIPAVIRVVESTNGETISQAPSGSSVSVGQDCWRRPCSVAPSRRYLHRASLLAWRRQRPPRQATSVPRLLAAHAVPEQPHCRFASALAGGMSAVRWGRSGTVGS